MDVILLLEFCFVGEHEGKVEWDFWGAGALSPGRGGTKVGEYHAKIGGGQAGVLATEVKTGMEILQEAGATGSRLKGR